MKYKVGDHVRIVDNWVEGCDQSSFGGMDHWLGKVMTIRVVDTEHCRYRMVEDAEERQSYGESGWAWNEKCIAGLASFTKFDLKNGDIVLFRNMEVAIYIKDSNSFVLQSGGWCNLEAYSNNMACPGVNKYDVMKVVRPIDRSDYRLSIFASGHGRPNIIYERKEPRKMTLAQVCAALGEEIEIVEEEQS